MSKQSIKATIDANIKQNGVQAITGQIMNSVLNQMVDNLAEEASTTEKLTELESEVPEFGGKTLKYEVYEGYIKPCVLEKGVVYRVENQTSSTMSINLYSANKRSSEHLVQEIGTISGGSSALFEVESDNAKYIGGYANAKGYIVISVDSDIRKDISSAALVRKRSKTLSVASESEKLIWGNLCLSKDTTYVITINVESLSAAFVFRIQDINGNIIVPSVSVYNKGITEYTFESKEEYDNLFGRFYFNGAANVSVSIVEQKIGQKIRQEILTLQSAEGIYAWEYQYTGAEYNSSTIDKFPIRIKGNKLKVRMSSSADDAPISQMFLNSKGCDPTLTIGKVYDMVLPDSYNWNEDVLVGFYITGGKPNQTLKFEIYTEGSSLVDEQAIRSKAFCDLFNDTEEADSYLYFTDPHTAAHGFNINRFDKHIETIKKIADGNPIQMVMCGGDWLNNSDTQDEACETLGYIGAKMKYFDVPSCLVVGNHDTNYLGKLDANSENGTGRLKESTIGNLWFGHNKTFYAHKTNMTRFYVLDTGTDSEHVDATDLTLYQIKQLKWLCESLISNDDIHNVLSFHIYFVLGQVPLFVQNIIDICAAYNNRNVYAIDGKTFDFSSTKGTIHCCICGHSHRDFVEINKTIPIISTILASDFGEDGQMNGDGSKVNLDLVVLDYTHKKFKSIRIGDGENREIDIL